jgi:hypothetical protein
MTTKIKLTKEERQDHDEKLISKLQSTLIDQQHSEEKINVAEICSLDNFHEFEKYMSRYIAKELMPSNIEYEVVFKLLSPKVQKTQQIIREYSRKKRYKKNAKICKDRIQALTGFVNEYMSILDIIARIQVEKKGKRLMTNLT